MAGMDDHAMGHAVGHDSGMDGMGYQVTLARRRRNTKSLRAVRRTEFCPGPPAGAVPTCASGPLARYGWLARTLAGTLRGLLGQRQRHTR
jgi:hypothetical protein